MYRASISGLRATDFWRELQNNAYVVHAGHKAYLRLYDLAHNLSHKQNKKSGYYHKIHKPKRPRNTNFFLPHWKRDMEAITIPDPRIKLLIFYIFIA